MMRPTRRDADHGDVRAEMRLDARARARPAPLGRDGDARPRFSRNLRFALAALLALAGRCTAAGLDCASTSAALATLGACASGADEACCAALGAGTTPGVSARASNPPFRSPTRAAQAAALAAACGRRDGPGDARHVRCPLCRRRRGRAAESTIPSPRRGRTSSWTRRTPPRRGSGSSGRRRPPASTGRRRRPSR